MMFALCRLLNDSVHLANHNLTKVFSPIHDIEDDLLMTFELIIVQLMVLKYEDLASQPSEQLAAIEERFNISLGSKEVLNFKSCHVEDENNRNDEHYKRYRCS